MKKKLNRKQRAEMPASFGLTGIIAMQLHSKKHRDRTKYDRKAKKVQNKDKY